MGEISFCAVNIWWQSFLGWFSTVYVLRWEKSKSIKTWWQPLVHWFDTEGVILHNIAWNCFIQKPNATTSFPEAKNFIPVIYLCIGVTYTIPLSMSQTSFSAKRLHVTSSSVSVRLPGVGACRCRSRAAIAWWWSINHVKGVAWGPTFLFIRNLKTVNIQEQINAPAIVCLCLPDS